MKDKIIHIKRTIEIEMAVPETATDADIDELMRYNFVPDGFITDYDGTYKIYDVRLVDDIIDDNQDNYTIVSWPESQALCEFDGYMENCSFISGADIPCSSYIVNKDWYSRVRCRKQRKVREPIGY